METTSKLMKKLNKEFYLRDTHTVAKELLGKYLVFGEAAVKITETESYIGAIDKACHAYGGRRTKRTEILFAEGGIFYIYLIYGMYCCLNVITERKDYASGVLIRGAEAVRGTDIISRNRYGKDFSKLTSYQRKNLLNGPGKVCMGLGINREQNGIFCLSEDFYIAEGEKIKFPDIKIGKRIGIDYAEEAKGFLWRYYL
ncbi:MAG: DNA-3-methyladenine glycosylase [Clostridiales bacterium]|nr:DNA-3-methyladenine glycosylase [Clostridiales bacterium]